MNVMNVGTSIKATLAMLSLLNAGPSGARAAQNRALSYERQRTVERWQKSVEESSKLLKAGEYRKSLRTANGLIDEMVERLGPGDVETKSFGVVLVHKALAHAGLGQEREAVWYWHIAVNLYQELGDSDLSMYGEPGTFLKIHPLPALFDEDVLHGDKPREIMVPRNVTDPVVLKKVQPTFPRGAYDFAVTGVLIVSLVIDEAGTVTSARVLKPLPAPTLSYAALEAVKRWRFKPGTENGTPVKAFYTLTFNYK
jgi:TonB family protein